ncbi:ATP-dependent endonuclease [Streptacidiphilus sp. P02-A3a]|uniref:ATP-dependent nuclease n=1 Tax=Streptacidiphilus sp. P02-A3a TaxID=2704468 RepID=UPI0015FB8F3B|nr:AAA family ATPase [Streptacidiphilus sp. P02-A3a]QMU68351.1 AAA family ATPase [Streptacidiphilus sp. P02-A3a]
MQLIKARITDYRSVEDSGIFDVEKDVTCLVGKNESGKTTLLQALFRVNPVERAAFDEVVDFPARKTRERKQLPVGKKIPVVRATFRLDDSQMNAIEDEFGPQAMTSREFDVVIGYRDDSKTFSLPYDEAAIVDHLRSALDLPAAVTKAIQGETTIADLLDALDELEEPPSNATALAARIRSWRNSSLGFHMIDQYALPSMPKFVYFSDYDTMPGKVALPDLIRRRDSGELKRGELALLSLLDIAGVSPEEFKDSDQHERLLRELENSGNVISDEVFEYWSQNTELEVQLKVLPPEAGALPPFDVGPILQIRVFNRRHRASVPFDDRSRGFVWFFSFLAYFNELEAAGTTDLILLLDEPGLSLHGRAQKDLLRLIDERLAPKHQVLYTTHSPFMVDPENLQRVRTVIDMERGGAKISSEIFKADEDTAFPLLAAMGIEMTQTLFVGEHALLLEGPSDLIYLDVLTDVTEANNSTGLDPRWVKTPIGGSGKLSTFVTLLGANKLNVAVLVDSSSKDVGAVQRLRDNNQLARNGLVEISEFTTTADADIEDLFERDFYLDLVNRAYASELTTPISITDLNAKDPRVVRQIEAVFKQRKIATRFNHYKPAAVLLREQASLAPLINAVTITRADQLFTRLNSLLPKR